MIYRLEIGGQWIAYRCRLSGRVHFDAYEACFNARKLARDGAVEAIVLKGSEEFAKFTRSVTGDVKQEGGVDL